MGDETETVRITGVQTETLDALEELAEQQHVEFDDLLRAVVNIALEKCTQRPNEPAARALPMMTLTLGDAAVGWDGRALSRRTQGFVEAHRPPLWAPTEWRRGDRWMHRFCHAIGYATPLASITGTVLRAYLGGPGVVEPVAQQHLELLTAFFGWCVEQRFLEASPVPTAWQEDSAHHPAVGRAAYLAQFARKVQDEKAKEGMP